MNFVPNAEQRQIREAAKRFFSEQVSLKQIRSLRDSGDLLGYSISTWQDFVDQGYAAVPIAEAAGGLGLGYFTLGGILEESGRVLFASPLMGTIIAGASVLELAGSEAQRTDIYGDILAGKRTLAFAHEEHHSHRPSVVRTSASRKDSGFVLRGEKSLVIDGNFANQYVVVARTAGDYAATHGLSLFLVPREAEGVRSTALRLVDSRNAAAVTLDGVYVDESALIGDIDEAWPIIDQVLDRLRVCLAAEMLGGIQQAFDLTIAYLKEREQFGVKIGSFQALKHRAAKMLVDIELTRSAVMAGLLALDDYSPNTRALASIAKARANDTFKLVSNESIQMHGGVGVTDALDLGFFLKRSRVAIQAFGDSSFHRNRYADLCGY